MDSGLVFCPKAMVYPRVYMIYLDFCLNINNESMRFVLGMQQYHFFRTEPIRYRKFWVSADTDPDPIRYQCSFFFFFNVEFLYFYKSYSTKIMSAQFYKI